MNTNKRLELLSRDHSTELARNLQDARIEWLG